MLIPWMRSKRRSSCVFLSTPWANQDSVVVDHELEVPIPEDRNGNESQNYDNNRRDRQQRVLFHQHQDARHRRRHVGEATQQFPEGPAQEEQDGHRRGATPGAVHGGRRDMLVVLGQIGRPLPPRRPRFRFRYRGQHLRLHLLGALHPVEIEAEVGPFGRFDLGNQFADLASREAKVCRGSARLRPDMPSRTAMPPCWGAHQLGQAPAARRSSSGCQVR